jgi:hypothetical protein
MATKRASEIKIGDTVLHQTYGQVTVTWSGKNRRPAYKGWVRVQGTLADGQLIETDFRNSETVEAL